MVYGFVPSKLDGTEKKFSEVKGLDLPESYSYVDFLPRVLNQGQKPICVPCSISAHLNWNKNVDTDGNNKRDNGVKLLEIYNSRTTGGPLSNNACLIGNSPPTIAYFSILITPKSESTPLCLKKLSASLNVIPLSPPVVLLL